MSLRGKQLWYLNANVCIYDNSHMTHILPAHVRSRTPNAGSAVRMRLRVTVANVRIYDNSHMTHILPAHVRSRTPNAGSAVRMRLRVTVANVCIYHNIVTWPTVLLISRITVMCHYNRFTVITGFRGDMHICVRVGNVPRVCVLRLLLYHCERLFGMWGVLVKSWRFCVATNWCGIIHDMVFCSVTETKRKYS